MENNRDQPNKKIITVANNKSSKQNKGGIINYK